MLSIRRFALALAGIVLFATFTSRAASVFEDFASDPAQRGWQAVGDPSLFHWNAESHVLDVTWDSGKTNSYFCRPLGMTLNAGDDFSFSFDLRLADVQAENFFELAIGLISLTNATRSNFYRATGMDSPNLVEFDYFPDTGYGATVSPTIISSNMEFASSFNVPMELTLQSLFHVQMTYSASNHTMATVMTKDGQPFMVVTNAAFPNNKVPIKDAVISGDFSNFHVDHLAICSYSAAGQDPMWGGTILAHGTVDNLQITLPLAPIQISAESESRAPGLVRFIAKSNWLYNLERKADQRQWVSVAVPAAGDGRWLSLADTNAPATNALYRVRADRR